MPIFRTQARKKRAAPSTGGGLGKLSFTPVSTINSSTTIAAPIAGYAGPIDIILAGSSSYPGNFWDDDNKGGTSGSGQVVGLSYTALGDETSFKIDQEYANSASGMLSLTVIGGANNGKKISVGSVMNSNNFGASGAAPDRTGDRTLPGTIFFNGSSRPYNSTIYYTDNTQYVPSPPASYGSTTMEKVYANGTRGITLHGSSGAGGLTFSAVGGSVLGRYGYAPCTFPEEWNGATVQGAVILAYPDGYAVPPPVASVFSAVPYSGTGNNLNVVAPGITNFNNGGMFLSRWRSGTPAGYSPSIWDTMRGVASRLFTERTQGIDNTPINSFNSNGVSLLGSTQNTVDANYVGLFWKFAPSFFAGKSYTGKLQSQAIAHNLQNNVGMIWTKCHDINGMSNWVVWHRSSAGELALNSNARAGASGVDIIGSVSETDFVVNAGTEANANEANYVSFIWAHDTSANGIIQCASFTTDSFGNADVNLGWGIQHLMYRARDIPSNWFWFDTARGFSSHPVYNSEAVIYNGNGAAVAVSTVARTATGFRMTGLNASTTYLFMAVRE